jgi:hypothetical protein
MGMRKIPRTDPNTIRQNTIQEHAASAPQKTDPQPLVRSDGSTSSETARTAEIAEAVRTIKHLPVRDDRILQVPSAGLARRESRLDNRSVSTPLPENNVSHVARVDSESSAATASGSKSTTANPNNRQFLTANAPNVLGFGPRVRNQPDPVSPTELAEVTVKPLTRNDSPQVNLADPFPVMTEEPKLADMHKPPAIFAKPTDPTSTIEQSSPPLVAEAKKPEPQTTPPTLLKPEPQRVAVDPFPKAVPPPLVADVKKETPQTMPPTQSKPEPQLVAVDPFPKAVPPPLFAEVKKPEPQTMPPTQSKLEPQRVAADSFPKAVPPLLVAEAKKAEPPPKLASVPTQSPGVTVKDAPKPIPIQEEAAGFASSRRSTLRVAITDDPTTGFARSKK